MAVLPPIKLFSGGEQMTYSHFGSISYIHKFAKGKQGSEVEIKPVSGVADGYKIARGEASVTGTADIATGLSTVVQAVACLKDDISLNATWVSVANSATAGNIVLKVWKPTSTTDVTPVAATTSVIVRWIAIGT